MYTYVRDNKNQAIHSKLTPLKFVTASQASKQKQKKKQIKISHSPIVRPSFVFHTIKNHKAKYHLTL